MKSKRFLVLLIVNLMLFALGQSAHTVLAADSEVEQEVRRVDDELRKALVRSKSTCLPVCGSPYCSLDEQDHVQRSRGHR